LLLANNARAAIRFQRAGGGTRERSPRPVELHRVQGTTFPLGRQFPCARGRVCMLPDAPAGRAGRAGRVAGALAALPRRRRQRGCSRRAGDHSWLRQFKLQESSCTGRPAQQYHDALGLSLRRMAVRRQWPVRVRITTPTPRLAITRATSANKQRATSALILVSTVLRPTFSGSARPPRCSRPDTSGRPPSLSLSRTCWICGAGLSAALARSYWACRPSSPLLYPMTDHDVRAIERLCRDALEDAALERGYLTGSADGERDDEDSA
jgi:hypothetical protein